MTSLGRKSLIPRRPGAACRSRIRAMLARVERAERHLPRPSLTGIAVLLWSLLAWAALAGPAFAQQQRQDLFINSFDGTPIEVHAFPNASLEPGERAPTILFGPGWAQVGQTDPGHATIAPLLREGYNVVTWTPRGFGASGGAVQLDSPEVEGRDVSAIIDWVARQPWARLDRAGDPRIGMAGGSYGGGIQYSTAARDRRVDAIVPIVGWHSLVSSLYRDRTFKQGWDTLLYTAGLAAAGPDGLAPQIGAAYDEGLRTGRLSQANLDWFAARGPGDRWISRIRTPTLIVGGTVDTLFPLDEQIKIYNLLRRARVKVKMIWFCGGHGVCETGTGDRGAQTSPQALAMGSAHVTRRALAWYARHLKGDRKAAVGPGFEWLADDARWRSADSWPLPSGRPIRAAGRGTLSIKPGYVSGEQTKGTPAPRTAALELQVRAPRTAQIVGAPRLTLRYRGTGDQVDARVYAQIVDVRRNIVVGGQVTPIPVRLDGKTRTVTRPLVPIAVSARKGDRYRLQIVASSRVWLEQRATGTLRVTRAELSLPTAKGR